MAEILADETINQETEEQVTTTDIVEEEEGVEVAVANGTLETAFEPKQVLTGDAEADEHDIISMPALKLVNNDLNFVHRSRRVIIHVATMYDLVHDIIGEIMRNQVCEEISFQFVRGKDDETGMQGVISMTFSSTKQASEYVPYIQSIRPDLVVEQAPAGDLATAMLSKWKKERASTNPTTETMLLVKNLDPATASVDKLAAIFPDAEDIVIASNPDASNQGKLKGRKHGYLLYKSHEDAQVALENVLVNPVELNDEPLIICNYKEPPKNVPEGYLSLSARKLVLRHIARFKGLLVRAQEDPLLPVKDEWAERLKYSTELIEKDDVARESLGLPKPTLLEFKDMTNLKNISGKQSDQLLVELKLADKTSDVANPNKKRPLSDDSKQQQQRKQARGGGRGGGRGGSGRGGRGAGGGVKPLMGGGVRMARMGFNNTAGGGYSMQGGYGGSYNTGMMYGGGMGFPRGLRPVAAASAMYGQRMSILRAAARAALRVSRGGWM